MPEIHRVTASTTIKNSFTCVYTELFYAGQDGGERRI